MPSTEEQKQIVKDVSQAMMAIGRQAMLGYISSNVLTEREAISIQADISTEVYMQGLSDLAYISRGRDRNTKDFIKDNNAIARRKLTTVYDVKATKRDEALKRHGRPNLQSI
jgi:hypothetical protein